MTSVMAESTIGASEVLKEPPQVEETPTTKDIDQGPETLKQPPQIDLSKAWKMYVYGTKNSLDAVASVVLRRPEGAIFQHCLRLNFPTTNNEAEYEGFIAGLKSANKLMVLHIFNDSKLVVNQVTDKFEARKDKMAKYLAIAETLLTQF